MAWHAWVLLVVLAVVEVALIETVSRNGMKMRLHANQVHIHIAKIACIFDTTSYLLRIVNNWADNCYKWHHVIYCPILENFSQFYTNIMLYKIYGSSSHLKMATIIVRLKLIVWFQIEIWGFNVFICTMHIGWRPLFFVNSREYFIVVSFANKRFINATYTIYNAHTMCNG